MKRGLFAGLALLLAVGGWFGFRAWRQGGAPRELDIFFTADVRGRLVPCGCFSGQLGGLTRIATMLEEAPAGRTLKVDVGDALRGTADYEVLEYRAVQRAFAAMGFAALNLGQREAQLPAATLRELQAAAPVPMISANLLDRATGAPLCEPFRVLREGPWRIAVVGLLDPDGLGETLGEGLRVEKMDVALGRLLPALQRQADFVVVLASAGEAALTALARQFYEIDILLGGRVKQPSQRLVRENRTLLLATTNESRALGTMRVALEARGRLTALAGEVLLVRDDIPQSPAIAALAQGYRDEVRKTRLAIDDPATLQQDFVPGVKAAASFAGTEACVTCHAGAAGKWHASGHARAWEALVSVGADADPGCIGCHSVGFGTASGYRREFAGARLVNVGCESCHGPGSQHVAQRQAGGEVTARFRPLGAGDCVKCHHGEFSRPFDYAQFWPRVQHGREPAPAAAR